MPTLLISVSNLQEYETVAQAGVDVIDLKSPSAGPMGMVKESVIADVLAAKQQHGPVNSQMSLALGELEEWNPARQWPEILNTFDYLKVAPRCGEQTELEQWNDCLRRLVEQSQVTDDLESSPQWIAVAYADDELAGTPSIEHMLPQLDALPLSGLLLDTWNKKGPGLLHYYSAEQLKSFCERCHEKGLLFGLAGQLKAEEMLPLSDCADVIGCRGAVCEQSDRGRAVSAEKLRELIQRWRDAESVSLFPNV